MASTAMVSQPDPTKIAEPEPEPEEDPNEFPYKYFDDNSNLINNIPRLISRLLYDREYEIISLLESCQCHYDCKCDMMCDCDPEFLDDDKCGLVKNKNYLDHWDTETKYVRARMRWTFRQVVPHFPYTKTYGYYGLCDKFFPAVQKHFPSITKYIEFREIVEEGYWQMCIRIAKYLKFPLAIIKINDSSLEESIDLLHYSYCTHNKRKKSKAKSEYDEEGIRIVY